MGKIKLEWVENGDPKQRTADALMYQLTNGSWGVEEKVVRLVLVKNGGSNVVKAFSSGEPRKDRWEERRIKRKRWIIATTLLVLGGWLGVLLF